MLTSINTWLAGFFACAALHYAIHWWSSRSERVLLVFSFQCLTYTAFCLAIVAYFGARTVPAAQATLDRFVSIGVIAHAVSLELYACLGDRRARVYRVALTGVLLFLALLNQWSPLRGTVLGLQTLELPGGATSVLPIRTPPGASLVALYVAVLLVYVYGLAIVPGIWRRDRAGAVLLTSASVAILAGTVLGFLVDFAHVRAPYAGAWPHAIFVLCVGLVLSREYAARGARVIATQRQFQAAFEHTPIGKAVLGLDGRFLAVNSALCRMLGRTAEQLPARRLGDFTHPEDMKEPQLERLRDEPAYIVETRLLRSDGEAVWVLLAVSAVPDDRGQPVQLIAQMQDVTELRAHRERLRELVLTRTRELHEAKDAAERANQAKSQFLAHISHEIRTPLHVIHAHAQSLERDPALGAAQRAKIGIVCSSGKHLQALISDVLEMSKIEAGRPELVESAFDPRATLVEVERMFAAEASSKGIELMVRADPGLPRWVLGDGAKVKQILINLASNALKFTSRGSIRLQAASTRLDSGSVLVEVAVADTGIGMAPADCARIFEPFEQLDAGKLAGGTGLGLAISLAHARLMNGDLRVVSTLGAGSTFTLTYVAKPLSADEMPAIPEEASGVERDGAQRKVLIVDDVALNRDLLSEFLAGHGFQTRTAADGADAVSLHAEWRPDLVLIDLRMRGMGGLEAIRQMRDSKSSAAIGALSASALDEDERNALAFGANFFMRKPYDYTELLEHISRVLGAPLPLDSGHGQ